MAGMEAITGDDTSGRAETSAGTVVSERSGSATILTVTGALDLALAPKLQQFVDRASRERPALLVLDLTGVDFLASAGMAVLVRANRQEHAATGVRVVAAGRITLRPLELTRLTDELAVYPTLSAALGDE